MITAASVPDFAAADGLLATLLGVSLTAIHLVRPVYGPDGTTIEDFALEYLSPAGQRMTGLAERPGGTLLTRFPQTLAAGIFDYYRRVFELGTIETFEVNYQAEGFDNFFRFSAQRHGEQVLVSFTDTADQSRTAVELALRESQAREQAARAAAERERDLLQSVLSQAPVAIGLYQGPDMVVGMVNDQMAGLWGYTPAQVLDQPLFEAVPELQGQGFRKLLAEVARTRTPFIGKEVPAALRRTGGLETKYFNFVYQPFYTTMDEQPSVLNIAVDVTEQVLSRQQVQHLNEELHASNEEFHASNTELLDTQLQLQELNNELEVRVADRTHEALAARAEAERQRQRLERLFMEAPAAICILDGPDLVFELVNQPYQAMFPGRELQGLPLTEALPEIINNGVIDTLYRVYETGESNEEQAALIPILRPSDGTLEDRYFNYVQQPRYNEHGQIDGVLVFAFEVTEQIAARQQADAHQAEALAAARRQVQERETFYQVFAQTPAAICIQRGPEHHYEYLNQAYQDFFPGRQLQGLTLAEAVPESVLGGFVALHDHVYQTGETYFGQEQMLLVTQPNGQPPRQMYFSFTYQPYYENGEIVGISTFANEVSEQVRAHQQVQDLNKELAAINEELQASNEELNESNTQLTRTNVDLDNFIYTASHDLKAPISNIEGLLHALREQLPGEVYQATTVPHMLDLMQGAVERFQQTISQLTDISRLQKAHAQPAESVNLAAVVEDVRLDLAPALVAARAHLTLDVTECPPVSFAPKNLRSILYNLLSNAIKYRAPSRVPEISLRGYCVENTIFLEVQDNGLGLDSIQQTKLFGMFQRLHDHVEGSGIGLYMVKKIVENVGGSIAVQSQAGIGSTFIVSFPN